MSPTCKRLATSASAQPGGKHSSKGSIHLRCKNCEICEQLHQRSSEGICFCKTEAGSRTAIPMLILIQRHQQSTCIMHCMHPNWKMTDPHVFLISSVLWHAGTMALILNTNKALAAIDSHYYFYFLLRNVITKKLLWAVAVFLHAFLHDTVNAPLIMPRYTEQNTLLWDRRARNPKIAWPTPLGFASKQLLLCIRTAMDYCLSPQYQNFDNLVLHFSREEKFLKTLE